MRWRKGFFRIWIVFSLLWLPLISFSFYDDIAKPILNERVFIFSKSNLVANPPDVLEHGSDKNGLRIISFRKSSLEYQEMINTYGNNELKKIELKGIPEFTLIIPITLSVADSEERAKEAYDYANLYRNSYLKDKRNSSLFSTAMLAFAPPLGFLISGIVIGWIISGFRRSA